MINRHIPGAVRSVGRHQGYQGISVLYSRREVRVGDETVVADAVETAWEPTPEELDALARGGSIRIVLLAPRWPPARIEVAPPGEDAG